MSLNDIDLGPKILADLYKNSLIAEPPALKPAREKSVNQSITDLAPPIRFFGKNSKNYCFLVSYPNEPFIPDDKMEVLIKIMQACKITLEEIALVNVAGDPPTIESLRTALQPQKMVLLGVSPTDIRLPMQFPLYKPQPYAGCTFLYSDSLDGMDSSESGRRIKTSLWNSLKEMFGL